MLEGKKNVYVYVVDRDFGFAPNPFHGSCSLATCKPLIRKRANIGDWVVGMGGSRLKATGKCIFAMKVTDKLTFNEYWNHPDFLDKRPVRNGSIAMMLGDNVYYRDEQSGQWNQADCHHSHPDGSPNEHNTGNDTKADHVLLSRYFYYFGQSAPCIPENLLANIGYKNGRGYRKFTVATCDELLSWVEQNYKNTRNLIQADPFDFHRGDARYDVSSNKVK